MICDDSFELIEACSQFLAISAVVDNAFGAIYAQVKKKASRRISRSSRASASSRIRLATSPSQLPMVGLFTLATFRLCVL